MLNHFRTVLLNTENPEDVHIPVGYRKKALTPLIYKLWLLLFNLDNNYRNDALIHTYLNLVSSSGYADELTKYDTRLSYPLTAPRFFDFNQIANPEYSDLSFPVFVTGKFTNGYLPNSTSDTLRIRQVDNTLAIRVLSNGTGKYITTSGLVTDPLDANISLTFTGNVSQVVVLAGTGLSIQFGKNGSSAFTDSAGKSWLVTAKAPIDLEVENRIANFISPESMDEFRLLPNSARAYVQQAQETNITVRKFALLLCALVEAINEL